MKRKKRARTINNAHFVLSISLSSERGRFLVLFSSAKLFLFSSATKIRLPI